MLKLESMVLCFISYCFHKTPWQEHLEGKRVYLAPESRLYLCCGEDNMAGARGSQSGFIHSHMRRAGSQCMPSH